MIRCSSRVDATQQHEQQEEPQKRKKKKRKKWEKKEDGEALEKKVPDTEENDEENKEQYLHTSLLHQAQALGKPLRLQCYPRKLEQHLVVQLSNTSVVLDPRDYAVVTLCLHARHCQTLGE